jgi:hypothetical protein
MRVTIFATSAQDDERVDAEAVGEMRHMLRESPTDVVASDYVVDMVAQRNEHRQEDQTVQQFVRTSQPGNNTCFPHRNTAPYLAGIPHEPQMLEETPGVPVHLPYQS